MLINGNALAHWVDHFYGYGSWEARTWFVAHEDGGGDLPEEVAARLDYFYKIHSQKVVPTLCDIREAYRYFSIDIKDQKSNLFSNLHEYRFGEKAQLSTVWKNLISFEHGLRGKKLPDLVAYQKNSFAVPSAQCEALLKLYPLPSPHHHAWYYSWLDLPQFPFLKSRMLYQEHVYTSRMQTILQQMATYKPDVVLMYGMTNINTLKKSVQNVFPEVKFKTVNAVKMKTPQHHSAFINGTILLITTQIPSLRHNRIETGFDWQEFGKSVRQ